ncbi:sulfite exporter TauE/SafE family protein [Pelagibius litoralis]|uniref:Probable membrane transporter protein n=1 Tax=Pelagibius litoralis TaxID=374515 RepID=A0A967C7K0_9PROT|nr:sulfite exporter TauE/SafE family protein [Pelagibius litoralis]NIA67822.1 sulfite exporter TauE/SafE family protein [Pelagibius litoralis]
MVPYLPSEEPLFFVVAAAAVLAIGISKSGFSGGIGVLAVPLMAVFISPLAAAAIMLPILCVMDALSIWAYRRHWHRRNLLLLLPGAFVGLAAGALTFRYVDEAMIRLVLGLLTLGFGLHAFAAAGDRAEARPGRAATGIVCGALSGFTSFVAHAGGPPAKFFLLRQHLDKTVFVGTNVVFFFLINQAKVLPYAWLGQFSPDNLMASLLLAPLAPLGIWLGLRLHRHVPQDIFYRISYLLMILAGTKLLLDGGLALLF